MSKPNLLDEFEFRVLRQRWDGFRDAEHSTNDIVGRVSEVPVTRRMARQQIHTGED